MKTHLRFFIYTIILLFVSFSLYADDLELTREFNLITSKNASGYLKPLFTTLEEGFNTSLYNTAYHTPGWSFGVNLSVMGMFIPNSQLLYDAELPDLYGKTQFVKNAGLHDGKLIENIGGTYNEPTIYGGKSYSIFAAPQNLSPPDSFYKSVGFLEGKDIGFTPALPILQLYLGIPTRTELILRFLSLPVQNSAMSYFTIGLTQNIDKLFEINKPDDPLSYGFNIAYHKISRGTGIDISSFAFGLLASNKFYDNLQVYGGLQFETMSGNLRFVRKDFRPDDVLNSPYSEIRRGDNLIVDVESFNSLRLTLGAAYDISIFRFHGDISYAAQPVINFGVSFKILEDIEEYFEIPEYEPNKPVDSDIKQIADINYTNPYLAKSNYIDIIKPKVWDFDIALKMNSIYDSKVSTLDTIIVEEFESRQTRAMLPFIFFGENESDIPAKYNVISKEDTKDFSFGKLLGKSPFESYYDVLNVIAFRLKEKKDAKLYLTGTNNNIGKEKNNLTLSRKRAENVKAYLTQVWNIDESRIIVEARNLPKIPSNNTDKDGQEENRRVEISSDDIDITAPIFIIDTVYRVRPDAIQYLPTVNSEAGLANWNISSSIEGKNFTKYDGNNNINKTYEWNIGGESANKKELKNFMTTNFIAKDKENNLREISLKHPIKIISVKDKRLNASRDTSLNIYNLILFDFNKSTLSPTNKRITDFIKSEINPQTDVTIYGYTDRIGNDEYNRKLSAARAESTGKSLDGHPYKALGIGESILLYNNDLPEGRFYCRTVVVEAKVPIN